MTLNNRTTRFITFSNCSGGLVTVSISKIVAVSPQVFDGQKVLYISVVGGQTYATIESKEQILEKIHKAELNDHQAY